MDEQEQNQQILKKPALETHIDRAIKSKSFILLILIFILSGIIYIGLSLDYVNFYFPFQDFKDELKETFLYFVYMFFVVALPLMFGEIYLSKKYIQSTYGKQIKKILTPILLFVTVFFSHVVLMTVAFYIVFVMFMEVSEGTGYIAIGLMRIIFYALIFSVIYTPVRFILFHILAIKRNHIIGVPLRYASDNFIRVVLIFISLILSSGLILSFDHITKGKYLNIVDRPTAYLERDPTTFKFDLSKTVDIDTGSFEIINKDYAKDKNYVYYSLFTSRLSRYIGVLKGANPETFTTVLEVEGTYGTYLFMGDKNLLFYGSKPLPWITDPPSFEMIKTSGGHKSRFYKDNVNVYYEAGRNFYPIDKADPNTFVLTDDTVEQTDGSRDYPAKDKNREYDPLILYKNYKAHRGTPLIDPMMIDSNSFDCVCSEGIKNGFYGFVSEPLVSGKEPTYIPNAIILLKSEDGKTTIKTTTNSEGRHSIDNLPCGRYFVTVTHPDYKTYSSEPRLLRYRQCAYNIGNLPVLKK